MKPLLALFTVFLLLNSCSRDIDFDPPYEGDKLVLNASLDGLVGLEVKLTHSTRPVHTYIPGIDNIVADARVTLVKEPGEILPLEYTGAGLYTLADSLNFAVSPGSSYHLEAHSPSLGSIHTNNITAVTAPIVEGFGFSRIGMDDQDVETGQIKFILTSGHETTAYYSLCITDDSGNRLVFSEPFADVTWIAEKNYLSYDETHYFTNEIRQSKKDTLIFNFPLQDWTNYPIYEYIEVSIGHVGPELFHYIASMNDLSGIEYGFAEPNLLWSNVQGGYGLFYSQCIRRFKVTLR
jgi:hypothetical protein